MINLIIILILIKMNSIDKNIKYANTLSGDFYRSRAV